MSKKRNIPKFYAMYKTSYGQMSHIDVVPYLLNGMFNSNGTISKKNFTTFCEKTCKYVPITDKEAFRTFVRNNAIYYFWAKCEWEFIAIDWPYREKVIPERDGDNDDIISINHPKKIDVFSIIEPNLDLITDILWNALESEITKSVK